MVKHDLKCQFRMDDVMTMHAAITKQKIIGMSTDMEKSMRAVTKSKMFNHNRDSNGENCGKGSEPDGCDKKQAPLTPGIQMATINQPKGTSTVRSD